MSSLLNPNKIEPIHLLEASQFVQDRVSGLDHAQAIEVWNAHLGLLGDQTLAGARQVHVRTETAMMLPDGLSQEEAMYPTIQYGELALRAHLGGVRLVQIRDRHVVMWMLCEAVLRDTHLQQEELPADGKITDLVNPLSVGRKIRRPLYAPVKLINFALPAL